uniref:C2H2-type domain-containing protein n=1 Tax=Varanus komodoensis TaxID=61221 RepID=A0A8D2IWU0_VARKO
MSAYRNHLRNHPRCKLNGSVPEVRQPAPAEGGAGEPSSACEMPREEPVADEVLAAQTGADPPHASSLMSPSGEERSGQGREQNANQPENKKARVFDICGVMYEAKAASEALQPLQFSKEQKKVGRDEEEADQEGGDGPSAEEEGSPSERPFQCDVCGRNYKHAGSLINHKQTHKTGLFHCGICHKQFYNLMALKNHNRTHFETKRYRCPECPKAFRLQKQLASHQRVHRDRKREPSSHSSRRFAQAKRAAKAETLSRPPGAAKQALEPEERPYRCGECGRTYRHAGSLLNHQKSHKVGHFACALCTKAYPNLMSLKNHQRIHYEVKRHRCPDCGKAFKWQRQLLRHQRRPHPCSQSTPGPGSCPLCPKRFPSQAALRNHSRVHSKKRFECSECGKAYRASRDLMRHLGRHHAKATGERPYKCSSCERTYRHAGSLLNHRKAHKTGLYRCSACQKEFYNLLALKNHLHTHTDRKRHRCPHCGKAFRTSTRQLSCTSPSETSGDCARAKSVRNVTF